MPSCAAVRGGAAGGGDTRASAAASRSGHLTDMMHEMTTHPFHNVTHAAEPAALLDRLGTVFRTFDEQDSGCVSYGLLADGRRWFVKTATTPEGLSSLRRAVALHHSVSHPAVVPWCTPSPPTTARRSSTRGRPGKSSTIRPARATGVARLPEVRWRASERFRSPVFMPLSTPSSTPISPWRRPDSSRSTSTTAACCTTSTSIAWCCATWTSTGRGRSSWTRTDCRGRHATWRRRSPCAERGSTSVPPCSPWAGHCASCWTPGRRRALAWDA